jgi:hypothetical protein
MEIENPLLYSQEPTTGPYLELYEASPTLPTLFSQDSL